MGCFSQRNEARKRNKAIRIGKGQGETVLICTQHNPNTNSSGAHTCTHTHMQPLELIKEFSKVTGIQDQYTKIHYNFILLRMTV